MGCPCSGRPKTIKHHPECFASEDHGPTPTELVLVGLAGCLTATVRGALNLLGVLGVDPGVRNGFETIKVHFAVEADACPADIEALVAQSQKRSAVYDLVANPTDVTVTVN